MFGTMFMLGGGRGLWLRNAFLKRHFDTQELSLTATLPPYGSALIIYLFLGGDVLNPPHAFQGVPAGVYTLLAVLGFALAAVGYLGY